MKLDSPLFVGLVLVSGLAAAQFFGIFDLHVGPLIGQTCTQEAKICEDGSAVQRTGPKCEFSACPAASVPIITSTASTNECNQDGKLCPDGSIVGRTGAKCEFAACPTASATSATLHTTTGQKVTGLNVTITPLEIVSDSRCPVDVQCIWAGTVELKIRIQSGSNTSQLTLALGKPATTTAGEITLTEVTPTRSSGAQIPVSSYRFTFVINKK